MRKILITGGAGFIGSNLIRYWLDKYKNDQVINLDKLTYASNLDFLNDISCNSNYQFVNTDLANKRNLTDMIYSIQPDHVIHLAAESHVDNSIKSPKDFINSNIIGTYNLLESCLNLWREKGIVEKSRFIHISTDEVYGTLSENGNLFTEESTILPNSPYSASKASSDHIVRAYASTYSLQAVITRCSNNFGENQHDEKFLPTIIRYALLKKEIPIYGQGRNIRDWLYVLDHCRAIDKAFHLGEVGQIYNIGANNEWRNIEIASKVCDLLNDLVREGPDGDYKNLITFVEDRLGHDYRYGIDSSKIQKDLGWKPHFVFEDSLLETVKWYVEKYRHDGVEK